MKERKSPRLLITGMAVIGLSLILLLVSSPQRGRNPFKTREYYDYPQFAVMDEQGNSYVIDTSLRRVLVADAQGMLKVELTGGSRDEGSFFYADQLILEDEERFFLLNYVLDSNGMFLQREEILEYGLDGKFRRIFYQRSYDSRAAELVQRGQIYSPRVMRDYLYFFLVNDTGIQYLRKSLLRETTEILAESYFPDANAYLSDAEWIDPSNFVLLDKRGHLIRGDIFGGMKRLELGEQAVGMDPESDDQSLYLWDMAVSGDGYLYLTDLDRRRVLSVALSTLLETESFSLNPAVNLSRDILSEAGFGDEPFIYYRVGYAPQGIVTSFDYGIYHADQQSILAHREFTILPLYWRVLGFIWYMGIAGVGISLVFLLIHLYLNILKKRLSLLIKQLLVMLPLMAGGILLISTILLNSFMQEYRQNNVNRMLALTQTISQSLDGDLFSAIQEPDDYMNTEYRQIRNYLRRSLNYNLDSWNEGLYFALYRVEDENLYGFMYLNNRIGIRHPFNWYEDPQSAYRLAYSGEVVFEEVRDISGNWLYGIGPVYNSFNEVVALLEIGTDLFSLNQNALQLRRQTMLLMTAIAILVTIFITFMTYLILRSLRILRKGVERIAEGDWNYQIRLRSNDEVSELGSRFNHMSMSINSYLKQIESINSSYRKFFPDQFLTYLDLQSLTEVKLGDQVRKEMTIMFSDIRSFTQISERMLPEENFDFLNRYLGMVGPIIRTHQGFIDKYIGDAIMALFPDSPQKAVDAAIAMMTNLGRYNAEHKKAGKPVIRIGVGIHSGELMLGILGEQERMQGTVISDAVNFAARLESLSKQMGASILISGPTLAAISDQSAILKRYMGRIQVIGKSSAVEVYELLNGLNEEEIEGKLSKKASLQQAIDYFEQGKLDEAAGLFNELIGDAYTGKVAELFIGCIERHRLEQQDANARGRAKPAWDGVLRPENK